MASRAAQLGLALGLGVAGCSLPTEDNELFLEMERRRAAAAEQQHITDAANTRRPTEIDSVIVGGRDAFDVIVRLSPEDLGANIVTTTCDPKLDIEDQPPCETGQVPSIEPGYVSVGLDLDEPMVVGGPAQTVFLIRLKVDEAAEVIDKAVVQIDSIDLYE